MATPRSTSDLLLSVLQMEKETFWLKNSNLSPDELTRRWAVEKADLISVLGPSAPTRRRLASETSRPKELYPNPTTVQDTPKMTKSRSDNPLSCDLNRCQNSSQHSAPMSRKRSNDSRNGPSPFTSSAVVPPLTINQWETNNDDEPFSSYTAGKPLKIRRVAPGARSLQSLPEISVYDNPEDFYNKSENGNNPQPSLSPTAPHIQRPRRNSYRLSSSPGQFSAFGNSSTLSQSPATPTSSGLTNATSFASYMTRQNSHASSSICGGIDMMKIDSQISDVPSNFSMSAEQFPLDVDSSLDSSNDCDVSLSENDSSHFIGHAGGVVGDALRSHSSAVPVVTQSFVPSSFTEDESVMKRSSSTETNASSQSRASRRSQEVAQSSRPLAPKLPDDDALMSKQSSSSGHQMFRIRSADGTSKEVVSISKTPYVRPTHDKVKCTMCNEQPDGFRGEHELRRHTERAHSIKRKAFVCIDISSDKKFLSACKACRTKKRYNAYYNAAAHLRRAHFNPKQKGRKTKGKPEERRGGKGGGDYPPMEILKMWMEEFEEVVHENMPPYDDDAIADLDGTTMCDLFAEDFEVSTCQLTDSNTSRSNYDSAFIPSPNLDIPNANHRVHTAQTFSSSAPMQSHSYSNTSLRLPQHSFATDKTSFLDLSLDVSMKDVSFDPAMVFHMSPFDNSQHFDEFDNAPQFPDFS